MAQERIIANPSRLGRRLMTTSNFMSGGHEDKTKYSLPLWTIRTFFLDFIKSSTSGITNGAPPKSVRTRQLEKTNVCIAQACQLLEISPLSIAYPD